MSSPAKAQALFQSLKNAPLLVEHIDGATAFDRTLFGDAPVEAALNFDQKLGHLYEDALETLVKKSTALEVIDTHVQVFDGTRTLGELDFILRDVARNTYIHLELAVKFYLALPDDAGGWRYPGPDDRDNWGHKRKRMVEHQFTLAQREETRALLKQRYGIETIEAQHLIYGCFFYPITGDKPSTVEAISPSARTGQWLRLRDWDTYFKDVKDIYYIPKPLWPVPPSAETIHLFEPITAEDLLTRAQDRGVMFALEDGENFKTYFMVGDEWGNQK